MSEDDLQITVSVEQMYESIRDTYYYCSEFSGAGLRFLDYSFPWKQLALIENFVSDIISSAKTDTLDANKYLQLDKNKKNFVGGRRAISSFDYFHLYDFLEPDLYSYSYHVTLYIDAMQKVYWVNKKKASPAVEVDEQANKETTNQDAFSDLIAEICRRASEDLALKNKKNSKKKLSEKNFESAKEYIDTLFSEHGELLAWRFDLIASSWKEASEEPQQPQNKDEVHGFLDNFLRNWRSNQMFKHVAGYIWKLEFVKERGYFFIFIFFISRKRPVYHAELKEKIGLYWIKTTNQKGAYFNFGLVPRYSDPWGNDPIVSTDTEKRQKLLLYIRYLTSKDYYLQYLGCGLDAQKKRRSFGHGQIKSSR